MKNELNDEVAQLLAADSILTHAINCCEGLKWDFGLFVALRLKKLVIEETQRIRKLKEVKTSCSAA